MLMMAVLPSLPSLVVTAGFVYRAVSVRHDHSAVWLLLGAPVVLPVSSHVVHRFGQSSLHVSEIGPLQSIENSCGPQIVSPKKWSVGSRSLRAVFVHEEQFNC